LPFELHIPGYNYCGPGTKLEKRLERGDAGVNLLDEACKQHDISYSNEKELPARHRANKVLLKNALSRIASSDASWKEKLAAMGVSAAMHGKIKLGMGNKFYGKSKKQQFLKSVRSNNINNIKAKRSSQIIMQSIKIMKDYLHKMQALMDGIASGNNQHVKNSTRKYQKEPKVLKRKLNNNNKDQKYENYHEKKIRQKLMDVSSAASNTTSDVKSSSCSSSSRKRKNNGNVERKKRKLFEKAIEQDLLRSITEQGENNGGNKDTNKRKLSDSGNSEDSEEYSTPQKKTKTF